jgi:hypothetical protein
MWQRIQTVFLGLVIVSMVLGLFYPLAVGSTEGLSYKLFPLQFSIFDDNGTIVTYFPYSITAILMAAAATIAFMEMRRFDNRILQIKMGTLNSLVLMGVMISAVMFIYKLPSQYPANWQNGFGLWVLFAGVLFNWLAVRFIRRDEKLVRDSDRIR